MNLGLTAVDAYGEYDEEAVANLPMKCSRARTFLKLVHFAFAG
jgi:FKBP-type peptidyl-prolyl cis-trans isomerase 2